MERSLRVAFGTAIWLPKVGASTSGAITIGKQPVSVQTGLAVVTWGNPVYGGDSCVSGRSASGQHSCVESVQDELRSGVVSLLSEGSMDGVMLALTGANQLIVWGPAWAGGDACVNNGKQYEEYRCIRSVRSLLSSGVVSVSTAAGRALNTTSGCTCAAFSNFDGMAGEPWTHRGCAKVECYALWASGDTSNCGNNMCNTVNTCQGKQWDTCEPSADTGSSEYRVWAALKEDGSVITWGSAEHGGDSSSAEGLSSGVLSMPIFGLALKAGGKLVAWGPPAIDFPASSLGSDVLSVKSAGGAYAALRRGGHLVMWGSSRNGGNYCVSKSDIQCVLGSSVESKLSSGVISIHSSTQQEDASCAVAWVAIKEDKSAVVFGAEANGGTSCVMGPAPGYACLDNIADDLTSGVVSVGVADAYGCAMAVWYARKQDGQLVLWGDAENGARACVTPAKAEWDGDPGYNYRRDGIQNCYGLPRVNQQLSSGVKSVHVAGKSYYSEMDG